MTRGRFASRSDSDGVKERLDDVSQEDTMFTVQNLLELLLEEQKKTNAYLAEMLGDTL
jgi:hypothetical protein